jgi:hypothetical protein
LSHGKCKVKAKLINPWQNQYKWLCFAITYVERSSVQRSGLKKPDSSYQND